MISLLVIYCQRFIIKGEKKTESDCGAVQVRAAVAFPAIKLCDHQETLKAQLESSQSEPDDVPAYLPVPQTRLWVYKLSIIPSL